MKRRFYWGKRRELRSFALFLVLILSVIFGTLIYWNFLFPRVGQEIDHYQGVAVYYNGTEVEKSHGTHHSQDGYYYGKKWQCVEFAKRFYFQAKTHRMPDTMGHAKDFFDPTLPQGQFNQRRGLYQYCNGGNVKPRADDLMVFTNSTYGHVAIVTKVTAEWVEIIQQNVKGRPREKLGIKFEGGRCWVGNLQHPAGWLRKE